MLNEASVNVVNFQGRDDLGLALPGDGQREVLGDFLILPAGGSCLLGRLGRLLALAALDRGGVGGLGVGCGRLGGLLILGGPSRRRFAGDRSAERSNQGIVFFVDILYSSSF